VTRTVKSALVVLVVVLSIAAGVGGWLFARGSSPELPEISVYSHGHATRVGPYVFCNVTDLNTCANPQTQGELVVNKHDPVQLSVPMQVSRAPWRLLRVYDDPRDATERMFRPDAQTAVTIPTLDPQRGRLRGIVIQLLTIVQDQNGELYDVPHAEWSVRVVWP